MQNLVKYCFYFFFVFFFWCELVSFLPLCLLIGASPSEEHQPTVGPPLHPIPSDATAISVSPIKVYVHLIWHASSF